MRLELRPRDLMKRGWLLNLVLLAGVLALSTYVWLSPRRDAVDRMPLSTLTPAMVSTIAVERQGRPRIEIERQGEHWMITTPIKARADEFQIMRLLTVLEAQPSARFADHDRARYDLDAPTAILTVNGKDFIFGGFNTVTREQYVLHGNTVHAVELRHGAAIPADSSALIRRVLLSENDQPVAIELPQFTVRKADGRWMLTPSGNDIGADDLQRYIDQWRQASAATAAPHDGRVAAENIRITMADGRIVEVGIIQREPQLVLWRRDNNLHFTFLAAAGRVLLEHPGISKK